MFCTKAVSNDAQFASLHQDYHKVYFSAKIRGKKREEKK